MPSHNEDSKSGRCDRQIGGALLRAAGNYTRSKVVSEQTMEAAENITLVLFMNAVKYGTNPGFKTTKSLS